MRKRLACVAALLLAACSAEPSADELDQAVRGQYDTFNAETQRLMGRLAPEAQFVVHSVRKLGCTPMTEPAGYACTVEVDLTVPQIGRDTSVKEVRLADEGDAWQVLNHF